MNLSPSSLWKCKEIFHEISLKLTFKIIMGVRISVMYLRFVSLCGSMYKYRRFGEMMYFSEPVVVWWYGGPNLRQGILQHWYRAP
jgi:hypothetical protein